jgi:predicted transcriptional regulator
VEWDKLLPVINGVAGGGILTLVLYWIITNKLSLPREVEVYKNLYDIERTAREKQEAQNDELVGDLRKSQESLNDTAKALQNANNLLTGILQQQGVVPK